LATYEHRATNKQKIIYVFATCMFSIHVWSIIIFLKELPALILRMNAWDVIGSLSYTLLFALVESLIILFVLMLVSVILPRNLFRKKFVGISAMIIFVNSLWLILAHLNEKTISLWEPKQFIVWIGLYLISMAISYLVIQFSAPIEKILVLIAERITPLSFLYLFVDMLSLFIILIRNFD
jgi:hypothetical protein